jgi:hypothetical protein
MQSDTSALIVEGIYSGNQLTDVLTSQSGYDLDD